MSTTTGKDIASEGESMESLQVPLVSAEETQHAGTLIIRADATLELTDDALVVHRGKQATQDRPNCCGIPLPGSLTQPSGAFASRSARQSIQYFDILWAEVVSSQLIIQYARKVSKKKVRPATLVYTVDKPDDGALQAWVKSLLDLAYGKAQRKRRIKVLINPFGGTGKAQQLYYKEIAPIFTEAHCELDVEITQYRGHAKEIARDLDIEKWDVIACCSGDGTPHEVFNGLALQPKPRLALRKIAVVQLPCGTGNALCINLTGQSTPSLAAVALLKGLLTPMDLVSITHGQERTISFLSQALGIIAESDLATEDLRWLGSKRFDVGFAKRAFGRKTWPCSIAIGEGVEGKPAIRRYYKDYVNSDHALEESGTLNEGLNDDYALPPLKFGTVNDPLPEQWPSRPYKNLGNLYVGNMAYMMADANFFPGALPTDGHIDVVTCRGDISGFKTIAFGDKLKNNTLFDDELVEYRKAVGYRIVPEGTEGYIAIDGERVPWSAFQAEVHQGLGCVLTLSGRLYEGRGL